MRLRPVELTELTWPEHTSVLRDLSALLNETAGASTETDSTEQSPTRPTEDTGVVTNLHPSAAPVTLHPSTRRIA